jgi:hypothetical protein
MNSDSFRNQTCFELGLILASQTFWTIFSASSPYRSHLCRFHSFSFTLTFSGSVGLKYDALMVYRALPVFQFHLIYYLPIRSIHLKGKFTNFFWKSVTGSFVFLQFSCFAGSLKRLFLGWRTSGGSCW